MRFLIVIIAALLIAACTRAPRASSPARRRDHPARGPDRATASGRAASATGFQVREGPGTKLQWSENGCVLDAFLYPPESGRGVERVMHADARAPSGAGMAIETCLALLAR